MKKPCAQIKYSKIPHQYKSESEVPSWIIEGARAMLVIFGCPKRLTITFGCS